MCINNNEKEVILDQCTLPTIHPWLHFSNVYRLSVLCLELLTAVSFLLIAAVIAAVHRDLNFQNQTIHFFVNSLVLVFILLVRSVYL